MHEQQILQRKLTSAKKRHKIDKPLMQKRKTKKWFECQFTIKPLLQVFYKKRKKVVCNWMSKFVPYGRQCLRYVFNFNR